MKRINAEELLDIRDRCMHFTLMNKSLYLLSRLYDNDIGAMAKLSIGERDARLLHFRKWIFGPRLINFAVCPSCNGKVEWEAAVDDILLQEIDLGPGPKIFNVKKEGYSIDFRLPDSNDIQRAIVDKLGSSDASAIVSACILDIRHGKKKTLPHQIPEPVLEAVSNRMAEADPQADMSMQLNCSHCGNLWKASFDILSYLWTEIDNWARRLFKDVALLARTFGWNEQEILSLSPMRRQQYIELII